MPARTVVFDASQKFDGVRKRDLYPGKKEVVICSTLLGMPYPPNCINLLLRWQLSVFVQDVCGSILVPTQEKFHSPYSLIIHECCNNATNAVEGFECCNNATNAVEGFECCNNATNAVEG